MATMREILDLSDTPGGPCLLNPQAFDEAIIGTCERSGGMHAVAYDRCRVVDILARDMPREDAEEWFEFNILGSWMGEGTPVFIDTRPCE
jgi:hypothetical protein